MSAPQMKERPASMLRAMFAGFGSLMSVMDKVRSKPAAEAPDAEASAPEATAPDTAAEPAAAVQTETVVAETATEPATAAEPETVVTETVVAETVVVEATVVEATAEPEAPAAEATVPETAAVPEAAAVPQASGALPLANYEELSVASLRARLRNLSNDDLTQLMTYEKEHQNRPEVIKMFQNRLLKMTSGLPKLQA
jgi:hypothetical protein